MPVWSSSSRRAEIERICNACDPTLIRLGGGFRDLDVRIIDTPIGSMVITHIVIDTRDAMGANTVNTMAERLAPDLARWTGGRALLRILSNLADRRLARARATWTCDAIGGSAVRDAMIAAYHFADNDPYRAATHNKGIMNGVSAVVLATGNDTRAVEAGAHAFAARTGRYRSLSTWEVTEAGDLAGTLELPLAVGLVGGAVKIHPTVRALLRDSAGGDGRTTGTNHCGRRPGAELWRHEGARHGRNTKGSYVAARPEHRIRGRCGRG